MVIVARDFLIALLSDRDWLLSIELGEFLIVFLRGSFETDVYPTPGTGGCTFVYQVVDRNAMPEYRIGNF